MTINFTLHFSTPAFLAAVNQELSRFGNWNPGEEANITYTEFPNGWVTATAADLQHCDEDPVLARVKIFHGTEGWAPERFSVMGTWEEDGQHESLFVRDDATGEACSLTW